MKAIASDQEAAVSEKGDGRQWPRGGQPRQGARRTSERSEVPSEARRAADPVPAALAERIERYVPRGVPSDLWHSTIRPFVVPALYMARPLGRASFEQFARVLTLIAEWCVSQGMPLEIEVVLDPDTVERFFTHGLRDFPSRGTYRTVARRLGRALTKQAPWEPRPEPMKRRKVALPYTRSELLQLQEDALRQSTAGRQRAATALISLGAGCGLDGRWVTKVRGTDVDRDGGVVLVRVGDPAARRVPVLDEFESAVARLAEDARSGLVVGGTSTHRNRTNQLVARFEQGHGHPRLSIPRLRSSWIVEHLKRGTRLPELLAAAGTRRIETFDELLEHVDPLGEPAAQRMLRGLE